jgi:hypothetical protein
MSTAPATLTGTLALSSTAKAPPFIQLAPCRITDWTAAKPVGLETSGITLSPGTTEIIMSGTATAKGFSCEVVPSIQKALQPGAFSMTVPGGRYAFVEAYYWYASSQATNTLIGHIKDPADPKSLLIVEVPAGGTTDVGTLTI